MSETPPLSARRDTISRSRGALFSALAALVLLLLITAASVHFLRLRLIRDEHAAVTLRLAPYVNTVSVAVNRRVARASGLKAFVESAGSLEEIRREFPVLAGGLIEGASGVRAIQLVKNGVIWLNYPTPANPKVIGYDLLKDPRPFIASDITRAMRTGAMTVTGPITMSDGAAAIAAEQRINSAHKEFPDLAVVMLQFDALFEVAGMEHGIPGLNVGLLDRGGHIIGPDKTVHLLDPVSIGVTIPDGDWTLLAAPREGWGAAAHGVLDSLWIAGAVIAFLLAAFVYLSFERQYGLAFAVQERTTELERANQELRREVSEGETAQTALRKHEESQLHRQKMEAIGTLAGGIAHDFNNILTAILGFGRLAEEQLGESAGAPLEAEAVRRVRADVLEMIQAAEHATVITNQLLSFSLKQMVKPEALNAAEAIASVEALLRGTLGERTELVVETDGNLPLVSIDKSQLTQVLLNLVLNAREAMPDGGTLTIATRPAVGGGPEPDIPPGRFVEISVADTGVGMSRDLRSRVFEPFFTTKGLGKGTGLGLSTVYGIVSRANGHVRLETAVSRGTTIRVFLPECASDPAPAQTLAAALPTGAGETILLADDESPVAELAARILKRAGYVVLQATSGEDAVKLYDAHPYTVDLLITDCVMPGMSGVALATQLRERDALLPVLFMSGYTDQLGELKAFKGGHCGELAKPFAPDALVQGATALLAKRVQ